jgi:hypothetical protein
MPKNNTDIRKEIWLPKEVLDNAEKLASKKGWSVKRYIESLIVNHVKRYYIISGK